MMNPKKFLNKFCPYCFSGFLIVMLSSSENCRQINRVCRSENCVVRCMMLLDIYSSFYFHEKLMVSHIECLTICMLPSIFFCSMMLIIFLNHISDDVLKC